MSEEEDKISQLYKKRDALIRELWVVFSDLSDPVEPDAWTDEDIALWGKVTLHSAVQGPLESAFKKENSAKERNVQDDILNEEEEHGRET